MTYLNTEVFTRPANAEDTAFTSIRMRDADKDEDNRVAYLDYSSTYANFDAHPRLADSFQASIVTFDDDGLIKTREKLTMTDRQFISISFEPPAGMELLAGDSPDETRSKHRLRHEGVDRVIFQLEDGKASARFYSSDAYDTVINIFFLNREGYITTGGRRTLTLNENQCVEVVIA